MVILSLTVSAFDDEMMNPAPTARFQRVAGQRLGETGMKAKILALLIACSLMGSMVAPLFAQQEENPNVDEITVPEGTDSSSRCIPLLIPAGQKLGTDSCAP